MERLKAATFSWSELGWNRDVGQVDQSLGDSLQTCLEGYGYGRQCRTRRGLEGLFRGTKQQSAILSVSDAVGADQGQCLLVAQPLTIQGGKEQILVLLFQGTQSVGQAGSDLCLCQLLLGRRAQATTDVDAAGHPGLFSAQHSGDLGLGLAVIVDERADDTGLVQGGQGSRWGIDVEQQSLVPLYRCRSFDDHRNELLSQLTPAGQALESIDYFVAVLAGGYHPQGQFGHLADFGPWCPASQCSVGSAQLIDRQLGDRAGSVRHGRLVWAHGSPLPWLRAVVARCSLARPAGRPCVGAVSLKYRLGRILAPGSPQSSNVAGHRRNRGRP